MLRNTHLYIALIKMLGTLAASMGMLSHLPSSMLLNLLYAAILTFDLIYSGLVAATCHELGIHPWRRDPEVRAAAQDGRGKGGWG